MKVTDILNNQRHLILEKKDGKRGSSSVPPGNYTIAELRSDLEKELFSFFPLISEGEKFQAFFKAKESSFLTSLANAFISKFASDVTPETITKAIITRIVREKVYTALPVFVANIRLAIDIEGASSVINKETLKEFCEEREKYKEHYEFLSEIFFTHESIVGLFKKYNEGERTQRQLMASLRGSFSYNLGMFGQDKVVSFYRKLVNRYNKHSDKKLEVDATTGTNKFDMFIRDQNTKKKLAAFEIKTTFKNPTLGKRYKMGNICSEGRTQVVNELNKFETKRDLLISIGLIPEEGDNYDIYYIITTKDEDKGYDIKIHNPKILLNGIFTIKETKANENSFVFSTIIAGKNKKLFSMRCRKDHVEFVAYSALVGRKDAKPQANEIIQDLYGKMNEDYIEESYDVKKWILNNV